MSFGGFGGFGQNNNNQQSGSAFGGGSGGFGQNNNTTSAFGSSNTGGGFGANNSGGGLFGNNTQQNTTSGFGSSGFGANTNSAFGANKPAFGSTTTASTTGGGLFGSSSNTGTTGGFGSGGGFGSTTTNSAFGGGSNTGGGLFGSNNNQSKPAFGASATTGGSSLFGGTGAGNTTTASTGFGSSGFGAAAGGNDPPGTGTTPFQAYSEKETTTNTTNSFQNIAFQDPYKKWSAEELRLADYAQGRRQGNPSGAGAFGQSSGFGAFGSNNNTTQQTSAFGAAAKPAGGLFGSSNTATTGTGFGQTNNTGSAFGSSNTGGGLFGNNAAKPAGGLFGGSSNTTSTTGGGLFGSNNNTAGGFGSTNTNTGGFGASATNTGGGLFGSNNNQQKPAGTGFSFGNTATANTGSAFGSNTNTGSAFGSTPATNTGGGLFGSSNTQQQNTGGGLFGNNNNNQQQQQSTGGFGGGFGQQNTQQQSGGLFGAKPATTGGGLFGNSTTNTNTGGGGLFGGNNNQQQQTTGAFGAANTQQSGGLFGNKPATTGGGLFGNSTAQQNTNTGGGLFGGMNNQNQQQNTGGGLFGGMNNQNQQKSSLFGGSTQSTGGGLFGNSTQNQGGSLFGGNNNQQQQNQGLGNSLLGNSQQANNAPQGLTANLNDVSAYGSPSLFAGVGGNEVQNPGPLATSLNGGSKPRRGSILPMYKLNPASASRFNTPQKRGFGFSYSNYGTPGGSPASSISSTPGNANLGRSLLGATSSSSGLSKSMSTNNLRRTYNAEDTILNPGAFSSSSSARWYGSTGSKKLVINRDIRSDLFSTPQKDKALVDSNPGSRKLAKKVSFDTANVEAEEGTPVRAALPAPEDAQEETPRQTRPVNNASNGSGTPEAEQTKNTELGIVHEEDNAPTPEGNSTTGFDNAPGRYWMSPTMEDLQNMNRMQRQKIDHFTVGRDNVGSIEFKVPVDMSSIDLDEICGGIIQLEPRSATVYPIAAKKPPVGKGLNVPARITLEQSWPRGGRDRRATTDQKRFNKHVERLKRITDTTFESYDKNTGVWVFSVEHFTTYGLDDSDDDDDLEPMDETTNELPLVDPRQPDIEASDDSSIRDDTFDFRRPRGVPGAFGGLEEMYEDEQPMQQSFLGVSSADSAPRDVRLALEEDDDLYQGEGYDMSDDEEMARSSVGQHQAAEHDDISSEGGPVAKVGTPGGILRARMRALKDSVGPVKLEVADGDDWTEMLRKTVSPMKRDRQQLREYNDSPAKQPRFDDAEGDEMDDRKTSIWRKSVAKPNQMGGMAMSTRLAAADKARGFATSIDLMNSLFEKPKPMAQSLRASVSSKGFPKWPYERQDKTLTMDEQEQAFHDASRPTWGPSETLVLTTGASQRFGQTKRDGAGVLAFQRPYVQTDRQSVRLASFSTQPSKKYLRAQDQFTKIHTVKDVPVASLEVSKVRDIFHNEDQTDPASIQEKRVWDLASILFDKVDFGATEKNESQARREALSKYWAELVHESSIKNTGLAASSEEKSVACLAGHRVADACKYLLDGKLVC